MVQAAESCVCEERAAGGEGGREVCAGVGGVVFWQLYEEVFYGGDGGEEVAHCKLDQGQAGLEV